MGCSISSLSIHCLPILFPDIFQFWTQYNHITDGKSILSDPVLTEHIEGEKHPEMSHFCGRHHNVHQPIDNSSAVHKVKTGPILQSLKLLHSVDVGSQWVLVGLVGLVFDGTCQMYWRYVTQDWCEPCQLFTDTPSYSAASATSLLTARLYWGIRLDPLLREQQNQLSRKIRCINKQCSAWGRPGATQWHSHLDITPQLPPEPSALTTAVKLLHTDTLTSLMTIYVLLNR